MEEQLHSHEMSTLKRSIEQAFLAGLVPAHGVTNNYGVTNNTSTESTEEFALILEDDPTARIPYPWNPALPESEAFFAAELPSIFEGWQEPELVTRSQSFFQSLDRLWATSSLHAILVDRFAARMPQTWLSAIAQQAQRIVTEAQHAVSTQSSQLADQLVQCVREIVPTLAEDDFYVLARPLAVQMRDGSGMDVVDTAVAQVPQVDWERLSDVQRARLSLAIARYAIGELQAQDF